MGPCANFIDKNRLIEVVFMILLSKIYSKSLKISLKEMFKKINFKILAITLLFSSACLFVNSIIFHGKICTFDFGNNIIQRIYSLMWLGLFEEMAFRGWGYTAFYSVYQDNSKIKLFNKFEIEKSALKASIMTNIFFALIHMQTYMVIYKYTTIWQYSYALLWVFLVGTYFTVIFAKTKSIWNAIILHAFWDWFITIMIF